MNWAATTPVLAVILFLSGAAPCFAQVQPGSTGGSIGKTDKSVSGGEANNPPTSTHPKRVDRDARQTSSGQSCNGLVGTWLWYRGVTEMTFLPGGTMQSNVVGPIAAKWTCTGKRTARSMSNDGSHEQYTIAQDGKSMFVTSTWGGGVTFTATKRSGD
jgi:hypothetical protein